MPILLETLRLPSSVSPPLVYCYLQQVEALYLTLLQASLEPDPGQFLARCLRENRASQPPAVSEKLRLRQEMLPLSVFALFLKEVQGEDMTDEVGASLV